MGKIEFEYIGLKIILQNWINQVYSTLAVTGHLEAFKIPRLKLTELMSLKKPPILAGGLDAKGEGPPLGW